MTQRAGGFTTVFLSSTSTDLLDHRAAVYRAIQSLDGYKCVRMEDFGARDCEPEEFCRKTVRNCDVFVGIVGLLYGSCPPGSDRSFTELEYEAAVEERKPRLIFLAPETFSLPGTLREDDDKQKQQQIFRARMDDERVRCSFTSSDDLATQALAALHNLKQGLQWSPESSVLSSASLEEIVKYGGHRYRRIMAKARQQEFLESRKFISHSEEEKSAGESNT